jgi:DNA-binding transcriptional LysR family regulator
VAALGGRLFARTTRSLRLFEEGHCLRHVFDDIVTTAGASSAGRDRGRCVAVGGNRTAQL